MGLWSWRSASVKKCVTTYLPNLSAPKIDGAEVFYAVPERTQPDQKVPYLNPMDPVCRRIS